MLRAAAVLQHACAIFGGTAFDESASGLDVHECAFSFDAVVADLDVSVEFLDRRGAVELDRIAPLELVSDDVPQLVDVAFGECW